MRAGLVLNPNRKGEVTTHCVAEIHAEKARRRTVPEPAAGEGSDIDPPAGYSYTEMPPVHPTDSNIRNVGCSLFIAKSYGSVLPGSLPLTARD